VGSCLIIPIAPYSMANFPLLLPTSQPLLTECCRWYGRIPAPVRSKQKPLDLGRNYAHAAESGAVKRVPHLYLHGVSFIAGPVGGLLSGLGFSLHAGLFLYAVQRGCSRLVWLRLLQQNARFSSNCKQGSLSKALVSCRGFACASLAKRILRDERQ
jgi:hypothetical protein